MPAAGLFGAGGGFPVYFALCGIRVRSEMDGETQERKEYELFCA